MCEFSNVRASKFNEIFITEVNREIEAAAFRQSELFRVPSDLFRVFPKLKHVDVELTDLKELNASDFHYANEMRFFLARFNQITEIRANTFVTCPKLKYIVMQNNKISHVDKAALNGLTSLEALFLDHNQLITLPDEFLQPVANLVHFSMSHNQLNGIPDDFFVQSEKLETLNVGHNFLTFFNERQFDKMQHLEQVQLNHNKLKNISFKTCQSVEIIVDENDLEILELNKFTRFASAWKNPLKTLILHEAYGTGRFFNISTDFLDEITFFVNEDCCTIEYLEDFQTVIHSFGDLSRKNFTLNEWHCKFEKTVEYQSQNGRVLNNVCRRQINSLVIKSESTTTKTDIESIFAEFETTIDPETEEMANVVEISTSTLSYDEIVEKGIWKSMKRKVSGWKNRAMKKWNDWVG